MNIKMTNNAKMNIKKIAYELYKIDWKHTHITPETEMNSLRDYVLISSFYGQSDYTYEDYLQDTGYNGELYVCFDEFVDNEYQDKDYIIHLLRSDQLISLYLNFFKPSE